MDFILLLIEANLLPSLINKRGISLYSILVFPGRVIKIFPERTSPLLLIWMNSAFKVLKLCKKFKTLSWFALPKEVLYIKIITKKFEIRIRITKSLYTMTIKVLRDHSIFILALMIFLSSCQLTTTGEKKSVLDEGLSTEEQAQSLKKDVKEEDEKEKKDIKAMAMKDKKEEDEKKEIKASAKDKVKDMDMKEDVAALTDGEELSEEF